MNVCLPGLVGRSAPSGHIFYNLNFAVSCGRPCQPCPDSTSISISNPDSISISNPDSISISNPDSISISIPGSISIPIPDSISFSNPISISTPISTLL